eukprot:TCONS_00054211-protein
MNEQKEQDLVKNEDTKKKTEFHCTICDKYYASYKSFGNHTRSYHSVNKQKAQCTFCGNCFTRKDNLQQHIRLFHSEMQTTFACKFCGESYSSRNMLSKHKQDCVKKLNSTYDESYNKKNNEPKTIILFTPTPKGAIPVSLQPPQEYKTVKVENTTILEPPKKRRRKREYNITRPKDYDENNNSNNTVGYYTHPVTKVEENNNSIEIMEFPKEEPPESKALDCTVCNITFLSEKDYLSHKPFCDDGQF